MLIISLFTFVMWYNVYGDSKMCDTFGFIDKKRCVFGKNSDRSPNESQIIQFIKRHKTNEKVLRTTYISIDQVEEVYSILISRPSWMWGCEMGVNEFGLCIGNEAIFTNGKYNKTGLTGMDLVRLALERCKDAVSAKDLIISLLKQYNQGGNCGFDHNFFYDNSFLIMDRKNLFVLETHGMEYNVITKDMAAISNCYSIHDQKNLHENKIFKFFSGAEERNNLVLCKLDKGLELDYYFDILREHSVADPFKKGSVSSPCMHAGGIVGDHTTSSMVVVLDEDINVYFTGCSLPCISLFKYYKFGDEIVYPIVSDIDDSYWVKQEKIHRSIFDYELPLEYFEKRNELEKEIVSKKMRLDMAIKREKKLEKYLTDSKKRKRKLSKFTANYWQKKNKFLEEIHHE